MRHGYSQQEGDWIDAVCGAMNRWAMAAAGAEAEARLWAGEPEQLHATEPRQEELLQGTPWLSPDGLEQFPLAVGSRVNAQDQQRTTP